MNPNSWPVCSDGRWSPGSHSGLSEGKPVPRPRNSRSLRDAGPWQRASPTLDPDRRGNASRHRPPGGPFVKLMAQRSWRTRRAARAGRAADARAARGPAARRGEGDRREPRRLEDARERPAAARGAPARRRRRPSSSASTSPASSTPSDRGSRDVRVGDRVVGGTNFARRQRGSYADTVFVRADQLCALPAGARLRRRGRAAGGGRDGLDVGGRARPARGRAEGADPRRLRRRRTAGGADREARPEGLCRRGLLRRRTPRSCEGLGADVVLDYSERDALEQAKPHGPVPGGRRLRRQLLRRRLPRPARAAAGDT